MNNTSLKQRQEHLAAIVRFQGAFIQAARDGFETHGRGYILVIGNDSGFELKGPDEFLQFGYFPLNAETIACACQGSVGEAPPELTCMVNDYDPNDEIVFVFLHRQAAVFLYKVPISAIASGLVCRSLSDFEPGSRKSFPPGLAFGAN